MGIESIVTCSSCNNIILPGDRLSLVTSGTLAYVNADSLGIEEDSVNPAHLCGSCSEQVQSDLHAAADLVDLIHETEDKLRELAQEDASEERF